MSTVIFVCTGNTCRSPMAECLFKEYLKSIGDNETIVFSRGLAADGSSMAENSRLALEEISIASENRVSVQLTMNEAIEADLLCVMSQGHKQALVSAGIPDSKILCLDIFDPYGGSLPLYRKCRDEIASKLNEVSFKLFGFHIDSFSIEDADNIAELEKQCFSTPWSAKGITDSYNNGTTFFVARTDKETVGYAGVQITADIGFVTNIAVNINYRGKGIGKALTNSLCYAAIQRGCDSITLEVRPSNTVAIGLYKSLGFVEVGRRPKFYTEPIEDAVLMTKNLQG